MHLWPILLRILQKHLSLHPNPARPHLACVQIKAHFTAWAFDNSADKYDLRRLTGDRDMHQCLCSVDNTNAPTSWNTRSILGGKHHQRHCSVFLSIGTAPKQRELLLHIQFGLACSAPPSHGTWQRKTKRHSTPRMEAFVAVIHPNNPLLVQRPSTLPRSTKPVRGVFQTPLFKTVPTPLRGSETLNSLLSPRRCVSFSAGTGPGRMGLGVCGAHLSGKSSQTGISQLPNNYTGYDTATTGKHLGVRYGTAQRAVRKVVVLDIQCATHLRPISHDGSRG